MTVRKNGSLVVAQLSAGVNQIPHGLTSTPTVTGLRPDPTAPGIVGSEGWSLSQAPDSTYIYLNVAGAAFSGLIDWYV